MENTNRCLEAKHMDLIRSLDFLDYAKRKHEQGYPQAEIDAHVFAMPNWFKSELTPETLELFEDAIVDAFDSPRTGRPEECMRTACECVIMAASEEDWETCIEKVPRKAEIWRPFWNAVREHRTA